MSNRYANAGPSAETTAFNARYEARVRELEDEGCTTSDAQAIADVEFGNLFTVSAAEKAA